jgi:hypothetical protein
MLVVTPLPPEEGNNDFESSFTPPVASVRVTVDPGREPPTLPPPVVEGRDVAPLRSKLGLVVVGEILSAVAA